MRTLSLKQVSVKEDLPLTNTKVIVWDIYGNIHEAIISEQDLRTYGLTNWYRISDYKLLKNIVKWVYALNDDHLVS